MEAVIKSAPAPGFQVIDVEPPSPPGPGEVLLRVAAASICGTDIHLYDWNPWAQSRVTPPRIVGHEMGGEVLATGTDVQGLAPGTLVAVESHIVCGECQECRRGDFHVCATTRILGVDVDGVFRSQVALPAHNLHPLAEGLSAEQAALMEPVGNAVHACSVRPLAGETVVVFGCGPIGCAAIAVARAEGARRVIAVDPQPFRLQLAESMGAHRVVEARDDIAAAVAHAAGGSIDCVLEMSGAAEAIVAATALVRPGGWISLLGIGDGSTTLDVSRDVVMKGLTVYGITGRRLPETWERTQDLLTGDNALDVRALLTHRFALDEIDGAIELIKSGRCGKVVLQPEPA